MPGYTFYECERAIEELYAGINFMELQSGVPINTNNPIFSNRGTATPTYSYSGAARGYDVVATGPAPTTPGSGVNSNVGGGSYGAGSRNYAINVGRNSTSGGLVQYSAGATRVGTGSRLATVAGKINPAVTAVAVGMQLGAKIDGALYNLGKFFDLNPPESLNPQTWADMASSEGGKWLLRTLFDIDPQTGDTTMYLPEDMIDYMYNYWVEQGMFGSGAEYEEGSVTGADAQYITEVTQPISYTAGRKIVGISQDGSKTEIEIVNSSPDAIICLVKIGSSFRPTIVSTSRFTYQIKQYYPNQSSPWRTDTVDSNSGRCNNQTFYTGNALRENFLQSDPLLPAISATSSGGTAGSQIGYIWKNGTHTHHSGRPDGITPDPNATQVDPSQVPSGTPITQAYPQLFQNPISENVPQPDGSNKEIKYYPVPVPKITDWDHPVSGTPSQSDPIIRITDPVDETEPIVDIITNPAPDPGSETGGPTSGGPGTPPTTGGGSSPTVTQPTGEASSLWAIYNPTQSQLDDFGSWLWSSNLVEQIKKLFNDPMQAIIGVHKVFVTPSTGSQVNIKCGYIDSGCPAAKVTNQYTTIDCGTVNVREYFGNVFDYSPYTEIQLYLPFIGVVRLDTSDVMRGSVTVKYHVDVITGACLAEVKVNRDGESAVLYQYSGSAIVTYPVSAGSYASAVTGVLSLAAGVAGTIMTGGAAAPALIGGAVGLSHIHANVQHSGGFSGSPGAMGGKKPYLIISRPQIAQPDDFEKYEGKPASKAVKLNDCSGFVKVKSINIDAVPATYGELDQIVSLLKNGVII